MTFQVNAREGIPSNQRLVGGNVFSFSTGSLVSSRESGRGWSFGCTNPHHREKTVCAVPCSTMKSRIADSVPLCIPHIVELSMDVVAIRRWIKDPDGDFTAQGIASLGLLRDGTLISLSFQPERAEHFAQ